MNILFIGDIMGRPGRGAAKKIIPNLKKEYEVDFIFANGENLAGGKGLTFDTYNEMMEAGIDYLTSGNHVFAKADFIPYLDDKKINVLRPANFPDLASGRGIAELKRGKKEIMLVNLMGRALMREGLDNPFSKIDEILKKTTPKIIIIDFHAETTSEKNAIGLYLDGRVSAVLGTHTHVATNDARVLPKGTAYITDIGMVGALNSVIGVDKNSIIQSYLSGMPSKHEIPGGEAIFCAVLISVDEKNGKAISIEPIIRFSNE